LRLPGPSFSTTNGHPTTSKAQSADFTATLLSVDLLVLCRQSCQHDHSATRRLVGVADNDDRVEIETTERILDEHGDARRRFVELWNERISGDTGADALAAAWQPVANEAPLSRPDAQRAVIHPGHHPGRRDLRGGHRPAGMQR
jgi:hypothetical protein